MAPKPEDVIQHLTASDTETKLRAVRNIKNEIIGSQNKKLFYIELGAVPKIVHLLAHTTQDKTLTIQAAATLGSFAYGNPDGVTAIVESGGLAHLLKALTTDDEKVLEVTVRSLRMIFQSSKSQGDVIFLHPAFERLVLLLKHPKQTFSEDVGTIFARCCHTNAHQEALLNAGALDGIIQLMSSPVRNSQAAGLDAIDALSKGNRVVCERLISMSEVEELLLNFTRDPNPYLRLLASSILTHVSCAFASVSDIPSLPFRERKHVLQVLVKLLKEPSVNLQVAEKLADLTKENKDLQRAAFEADAGKILCNFLKEKNFLNDQLRPGVLKALGIICRDLHECRGQIIQSNAIHEIIHCLESPSSKVQVAAALCIKNMSRTVKDLNSGWIHSSVPPLLQLLKDEAIEVKSMACEALCNLLMDEICAKTICAPEPLALLVELTQSEDPALTSNAAWAFKNLAFSLKSNERRIVLKELPWSYVKKMISASNHNIQESALRFLQNMCCNATDSITQSVLSWSNDELLPVVTETLDKNRKNHPEVVEAALKVASNVSTGLPEHQAAVMKSGIPLKLIPCLRDERSDQVRSAAAWCVINLTWREQDQSKDNDEDAFRRATKLRELGIEAELEQMQNDESLNVRERVKTALGFFQRLNC